MDLKLGETRSIIDACKANGVLRNQTAYVLATTWHETAHTMKPIYERGAKAYFNKYEPGTKIGKNLGNTTKGDGFLYRGRGFTQITGRANYLKAGNKLKIDLIGNPDLALLPKVAAQILVIGMIEGWFTGKKLSNYITDGKSDFTNARRIINGTDKAALIAGYAQKYNDLLLAAGYAAPAKPEAQKPVKVTPMPAAPIADKPVNLEPVEAPAQASNKEVIMTVQRRLKDLGYNPGGADGILGPLTRGSILSFKNDNKMKPVDTIDDELLTALATAKPREMVPARANATVAEVAAVVPEARVHWWTRLSAGLLGGSVGGVGLLDQITPAVGYLTPVKDFIGDVPPLVWVGGIVLVCGALYLASQYGATKAKEAFNAGDRR